MFLGVAIAHNGLFDEARGVFGNAEATLFGKQQDDAADLAELHCNADVLCIERFLDRYNVRAETLDQFVDAGIDTVQTLGESLARVGTYSAEFHGCVSHTAALDHAPTERLAPGINP